MMVIFVTGAVEIHDEIYSFVRNDIFIIREFGIVIKSWKDYLNLQVEPKPFQDFLGLLLQVIDRKPHGGIKAFQLPTKRINGRRPASISASRDNFVPHLADGLGRT